MLYNRSFTVWSMALFIAWALCFPFFGCVLNATLKPNGFSSDAFAYIFLGFHALGYVCGVIIEKKLDHWMQIMRISLITVLAVNILLWFIPLNLWYIGLAILGFASAFYILGWSLPFTKYDPAERFLIIIKTTIQAILVAAPLVVLSFLLSPYYFIYLTTAPLAVIMIILIKSNQQKKDEIIDVKANKSFSNTSMLILFLFIIMMYLNFGILYGDLPYLFNISNNFPMVCALYILIPSLIVYSLILRYHHKIARHYLLSTGIALTGLAYVSLIFFDDDVTSYILTATLLQTGLSLIHLLIWSLLGDLAHIFGKPIRFFGYNLIASVTGIIFGGTFGKFLFIKTGTPKVFISIFALATICVAIIVLPWLKENLDMINRATLLQKTRRNSALLNITDEPGLTKREKEVIDKLIQGLENKVIARQLFICETTLKTHLRSIYKKFEVGNKSEFLAKVVRKMDQQ